MGWLLPGREGIYSLWFWEAWGQGIRCALWDVLTTSKREEPWNRRSRVGFSFYCFPNQGQGKAVKDSTGAWLAEEDDSGLHGGYLGRAIRACAPGACLKPGKKKDLKDFCYIFLDRVSQPRLMLSSLCNSSWPWTPGPSLSSGLTDEHPHALRSGYVLSMLRMQDLWMHGKHLPVKLCLQPSAPFSVCLSIHETTITYFLRWLMKVRVIWDSEVTQTTKLTTWRQQSLSTWVGNSGFWTKIVACN